VRSPAEKAITVYYSILSETMKQHIVSTWKEGSTRIIVATSAWGMGINNSFVERVIQWKIAKLESLDTLMQSFGRCARDSSIQARQGARITEVMEFMKGRGFHSIREFLRHFFTNQSTKAMRDAQDNFYHKGGFEEILGIWLADQRHFERAVVALPSSGRGANVAPAEQRIVLSPILAKYVESHRCAGFRLRNGSRGCERRNSSEVLFIVSAIWVKYLCWSSPMYNPLRRRRSSGSLTALHLTEITLHCLSVSTQWSVSPGSVCNSDVVNIKVRTECRAFKTSSCNATGERVYSGRACVGGVNS